MKKTVLILSAVVLVSCQKPDMPGNESEENESMNTCAVVNNEAVPDVVQNAFVARYPQTTAEKWFNKDDAGFSALFTQNGTKMAAQFDNDGTFRTEVVPLTAPSSPQNIQPPPNGQHPPKDKCGKRPPHKPRPFIPMMKKKKRGDCSCNKEGKPKECQVVLAN